MSKNAMSQNTSGRRTILGVDCQLSPLLYSFPGVCVVQDARLAGSLVSSSRALLTFLCCNQSCSLLLSQHVPICGLYCLQVSSFLRRLNPFSWLPVHLGSSPICLQCRDSLSCCRSLLKTHLFQEAFTNLRTFHWYKKCNLVL